MATKAVVARVGASRSALEIESGHLVYVDAIPGYPPNSLVLSPKTAHEMLKAGLPLDPSVQIFRLSSVERLVALWSLVSTIRFPA